VGLQPWRRCGAVSHRCARLRSKIRVSAAGVSALSSPGNLNATQFSLRLFASNTCIGVKGIYYGKAIFCVARGQAILLMLLMVVLSVMDRRVRHVLHNVWHGRRLQHAQGGRQWKHAVLAVLLLRHRVRVGLLDVLAPAVRLLLQRPVLECWIPTG
jgi:hypothetical protein